jgi:starch-binding outer membrane protein, SusD/RagB family
MRLYITVIFLFFSLASCKKFLDAKSNQRMATPSTAEDLQAILDNFGQLNRSPAGPLVAMDGYYLSEANLGNLSQWEKQVYAWDGTADVPDDWNNLYRLVLYANTVLDNVGGIAASEVVKNELRGSALFFRAWAFYHLAQEYAPGYADDVAAPGIPLRLTADFDEATARSSTGDTYAQMVDDLTTAVALLPNYTAFKTRPGKTAAHALLARVELMTGAYASAALHADSSLLLQSTLIDYASLDAAAMNPFERFNEEVIFHAYAYFSLANFPLYARVDAGVFDQYAANDLRKGLFFYDNGDGTVSFKGNYNGSFYGELFTGIAVDEVVLTRAECRAQQDNVEGALADLNGLLTKRIAGFVPLSSTDASEVLGWILVERQKELLFRGLRWSDLKRLNNGDEHAQLITRAGGGTLAPNDPRYTFLIPTTVIRLSGIAQNPR